MRRPGERWDWGWWPTITAKIAATRSPLTSRERLDLLLQQQFAVGVFEALQLGQEGQAEQVFWRYLSTSFTIAAVEPNCA
jgi:hypothetical protein